MFPNAPLLPTIWRIVEFSQQYAINFIAHRGYNLTREAEVRGMDAELCLQDIGRRIMERRRKLGLTQEALAEKGDVTAQFVSYAEAGKRAMRPENLLKIAAALGVSADYLLTGDIIDKDLLLLADKLRRLTPAQVRIVESIIDECCKLYRPEP